VEAVRPCEDLAVEGRQDGDQLNSIAWLEWWANGSTLLARFQVRVTISHRGDGWAAFGRLAEGVDPKEFEFMCEIDPVFRLLFPDESTIAVEVLPIACGMGFTLNAYVGPSSRPISYQIDLEPEL
jgi:hypothetical protein